MNAAHDAAAEPFTHTGCHCCIDCVKLQRCSPPTPPHPQSVCCVCTGLHHHVCWGWNMHVWMKRPSPPASLLACGSAFLRGRLDIPPRTEGCSFSTTPSSVSAASHPSSSAAFISHTPPSTVERCLASLCLSQNSRATLDSRWSQSRWLHPPAALPPLFHSARPGLSSGKSPSVPSSSPSSTPHRRVWYKAAKLSLLPRKVYFGWAAGLPLPLWRMILWMKTEEMALGELLERLRSVTRTIGG